MRAWIGGAALAAALAGATAAEAQVAECAREIAAARDRMGIAAESVTNVQQARNFYSTEGHVPAGLQTFIYVQGCRGAYVIETSRGCRVEQTYATGTCRLAGGR